MSRLERQQQALLAVLFASDATDYANVIENIATYAHSTNTRGLKAYIANGHFLAERTLAATYPVTLQLLGSDSFADLARALWHAHPPQCGDIARWGADLPTFLQYSQQLQDEPYLPDVARAEWALHQCSTAANACADLSTLALLTTEDPGQLQVHLAPGCAVLRSAWPVVSILDAHRPDGPTLAQVGEELRAGLAQDLLVWRDGLRPRMRQAAPGEADLLQALMQKQFLAQAVEAAPALDFPQWLHQAVHTGLLMHVSLHECARCPPL